MSDDIKCLHEGKGACQGAVEVVENPYTYKRYYMCDHHTTEYLDMLARVAADTQCFSPCPDCRQMECVC
jgi:ABC-type uncharacterized transport system ATPase subunit